MCCDEKVFVLAKYRSMGVGLALYKRLLAYAVSKGVKHIILDTPSVAKTSHRFYERAGFYKISAESLPIDYTFPDRNSILYILDL